MDISLICQDMQQLQESGNRRIARDVWRIFSPLQESSNQANHLIAKLEQNDLENRMRRINLRFIGLLEGNNHATFLEELLIASYGHEAFSVFMVEHTH